MADYTHTDSDITLNLSLYGGRKVIGGTVLNPLLDFTFYAEPIEISLTLSGETLSKYISDGSVTVSGTFGGEFIDGVVISDSTSLLDLELKLYGDFKNVAFEKNWVAWSKIGSISVTPDRSNEAGKRPMEWQGWNYKVLQLGKNAIVYGENGICLMYPSGSTFGFRNLHKWGLLDNCSVAGDEFVHWFIDSNGVLWRLSEQGKEKLGYEEFLLPLKVNASTRVVCLWDSFDGRLLISNGSSGYVFSEGLGEGYDNVTGVGQVDGSKFYTAPASITTDPMHLATDAIDMRYRGLKTITMLEVGTDTSQELFVAIDYRYQKTDSWTTGSWIQCNPEGVAFPITSGVEFRFRVKQTTRSDLEIDYINVRYKIIDGRFRRGPIAPIQ